MGRRALLIYQPAGRGTVGVILVEGDDYTVEGGRWVFTAAFLLRRGFCCGSGCRNCPYRTCPGGGAVLQCGQGTPPRGRSGQTGAERPPPPHPPPAAD